MTTPRKRKFPDGAFWLAALGYRPWFADTKGYFSDATEAFYAALTASTGTLDTREYSCNAERNVRDFVPKIFEFYPRGHDATVRVGTEKQILEFNKLFCFVQAAIEAAYQHGLKDGQDLLGQLAAGTITVDQLNRKAAEEP